MRNIRRVRTLALAVAGVLAAMLFISFASAPVMAQATTGTLRGTVTDAQGAVVPGATVTVRNEATGEQMPSVTTSGDGNYEVAGLKPGKYTVTVEATSFKRSQTTGADIKVGVVNPLDIKLEAGNVSETVTVVASTEEVLNTDQSQISHTFESRKIEDLPSNAQGSGLDTLALLIPGVAQNSGGGTNTNGTGLSVNGNRGRSNNFQIDGSDNNDLSVGGPNLFVDNQDQIQEYQVVTNNFSAQYGRNLGAVVNIVTKAGTNEFHGTGFEYYRSSALDALDNIERASGQEEPTQFLSNVFGGTVGGPIVRNRAFFFFSYEGIRQPASTLAQSGGFGINAADLPRLTAAFPGNAVINSIVALNPSVLTLGELRARSDLRSCNATTERLAGRPFADCNRDFIDIGPTAASAIRVEGFLLERTFPIPYTQDEWSLRGDMKVTDRDSFYLRYLDQKGVNVNSLGSTNGFTGDVPFRTRNFGGTYIRQIGSKMVNEFRGVRTKLFVSFGGGCDATNPGCIPDVTEIDQAQIENINPSAIRGVTLVGNALRSMGVGGGLPQGRTTTLYGFADNLTWTRGKHSLMMGAEIKYTTATVPFLPNYGGSYTFALDTSIPCPGGTSTCPERQRRVFNNAPSAFSVALGNPNVAYTEWDQYYFVQDDFKWRPNITLNLGVRYEYTGQPINDLNDFTVARESGAMPFFNPALPVTSRVVPRIAPDKNNFAPRVGFAYSPRPDGGFFRTLFGEDATVIRGGYAIAYDPAFYNILLNVANSSPFSIALAAATAQLPPVSPLIQLPNSIFGADVRDAIQASGVLPIGKLDPRWLGQTTVSSDFHSPYSQQWSFGVQRSFGRNNIGEVRYVGNHGVGLFQSINGNPFIGVPGSTSLGGLFGFNRTIRINGVNTVVSFPNFASQVIPGVTGQLCTDVAGTPDNEGACLGRVVAGIGARTIRANTASSNYHALQARYNGRFLKNAMNLGLAYTFSKTLDTASEIFNFNGEASNFPQHPLDYTSDYGVSALHRPHIFSMNAIYDVPFYKEQRGFVGHLLGGWQLNATHVFNSGRRYTAGQTLNSNNLGLGPSYLTAGESLRPFYGNPNAPQTAVGITQIDAFLFGRLGNVTDPNGLISMNDANNGIITPITANDVRFIVNGPGAARLFGTPYGDVPRYTLTGPTINQTNFGIFKTIRVVERVKIQLRGEFFNVFNHPNAGYGVTRNSSLPNALLDNAGNASGAFADNSQIELAQRRVQVGLRIIF